VHAIGIPRLDPGAEGIYLVWTWPDLLPLSENGYDVQRRESLDQRDQRCETIDQPMIVALDARGEVAAPLGPLRLRREVRFRPLPSVRTVLRVSSPKAVAGDYPATPLEVGGSPPAPSGQAGALVLVQSATGTASQGCDAKYTNAAQVKGNLALVMSGTCDLQTKVQNAQQNGAIGAVVFDGAAGQAAPITPRVIARAVINIPVVSISAGDGVKLAAQRGVKATLATVAAAGGVDGPLDAFIQELTVPTDLATVRVAKARGPVVVVALFQGKAVAALERDFTLELDLRAPAIDTVVVYGAAITAMQICVGDLPDAATADAQWSAAPFIVKGLTLPLAELVPTLAAPNAEFQAATSRLVAGELLARQSFDKLAATQRQPAAAAALGRSGERVVLVRTQTSQAYEELAFEGQLAALSLDPKLRRVLGFGFADRQGLAPGHTYVYRITGRFHAEDLFDDVYDVHLVAASTPLPTSFNIRGLGVRFQQPAKVVLDPPPPPAGLLAASRRGIGIDPSGFDSSCLTPSFGGWSAVFDLPRPVTDLVLEVAPGHAFTFAAGDMAAFGAAAGTPLPAGTRVPLHFAAPITQLRLAGIGTLYALRLPSGKTGIVELHAETAPILFAAQPLPAPPVTLTVDNLQQPPVLLTGAIDDSTKPPPRNPVGFKLAWLPAVSGGVPAWPDDLDTGPPLDAVAYQVEHRRTDIPGPWEPLQGGDNLVLGSRDASEPAVRLQAGVDLDEAYPRVRPRPPGTGFLLHLSDVFGLVDPATGTLRPAQPLGSLHQYRIRAVDPAGRVSASWTLSNIARLEKHVPPPLPAGQQPPPPIDAHNHLTAPPGPRARALVAGAPGLTAADKLILGAHANAVVLTWGWRQQERDLDPTTAEFRVYVSPPLDVVSGAITAVASVPPNWQLSLTCDAGVRPLAADECAGQWITTGGYPFRILHHDAGSAPHVVVEPALARPGATPVPGAVVFGRPLQPVHQRPAGWQQRVAVVPLTASDSYSHVFFNLLSLSPAHPRDALWVGVAAADHESYVADELAAGPNAPRPGNESSIAACTVAARFQGQPVFSRPAPVGNVPELVTEEPTGRQVLVSLNLVALVGGALPAGSPIALERCSADDVLSRTSVDGAGRVLLADSDGTAQVIALPTPADQAAVVAALGSSDPRRLANRYQIYLLAHAAHPESFFARVSGQTQPVAVIDDRLPPKGRYFYRVLAADLLGHVSEGSAILPLAVRVPSTAPAAMPLRRSLAAGASGTGVALTVEVPADPDTTHVLLFAAITPAGTTPVSQAAAELLRLANRPDLYLSGGGLRLQLVDGSLLAPAAVKPLTGPGVTIGPGGGRILTLAAPAAHNSWVTLWCYGLTRDGFPSSVCGPFSRGVS
jgi:hypothetical protein